MQDALVRLSDHTFACEIAWTIADLEQQLADLLG